VQALPSFGGFGAAELGVAKANPDIREPTINKPSNLRIRDTDMINNFLIET
jgi:hypothetical protein